METPIYPIFDSLSELASASYMNILLKPYAEALNQININDGAGIFVILKQWINRNIPDEYKPDLLNVLDNNNELVVGLLSAPEPYFFINAIKSQILAVLGYLLIDYINKNINYNIITPWDLAKYRNTGLIKLFGNPIDKLSIILRINGEDYQNDSSEEYILGLLLTFQNYFDIYNVHILFMNDEIGLQSLLNKYITNGNYYADISTVPDYKIYFNSIDFIQGITTGSNMLGIDPHTIITSLYIINDEGKYIELEFD